MLVEVDLCYVFLYASFGTVTMLCIWSTKNIPIVNIQWECSDYQDLLRVKLPGYSGQSLDSDSTRIA